MKVLLLLCVFYFVNLLAATTQDLFFLRIEGQSVTETTSNESCTVGTRKLSCLCGDELIKSHRIYREQLNNTCSGYYDGVRSDSPFSFCDEVFQSLGYEIKMENASLAVGGVEVSLLNQSQLAVKVRSVEANLDMYKRILDRTLVGVLIETEEHRCSCFDKYKRWLCTTRLGPFYFLQSSSLRRIKPCISICHEVLQHCPYYLPSQYQHDNELIYGGYPAFDCPSDMGFSDSTYTFNHTLCIGSSGTCYGSSLSTILTLLAVVYFLEICSVT